jgi:hypothetical protein
LGVVFALAGLVLGVYTIFYAEGGKFWFYWIAPLLMLGLGGLLIALTIGYWVRVGRLAVKGRPRGD